MNEIATIQKIEQSKLAIREVKTLDEIKQIVDQTEALKAYVRSAQMSAEIQADIAELSMRATRRMGEVSATLENKSGMRTDLVTSGYEVKNGSTGLNSGKTKAEVLSEVGVSKMKASRAEKLAEIPEEEFEASIAAAKAAGERITKSIFKTEEEERRIEESQKAQDRIAEFRKTGIKPKGWRKGIDDKLLEEIESAEERVEGYQDHNEKKAQSTINADKDPVIETTLGCLKLMIKASGKDYMIAVCKALKTGLSKLIAWAEKQ